MATDAVSTDLQREADHAANDAASEARAEVLERGNAEPDVAVDGPIEGPERSKSAQRKTEAQSTSTEQWQHFVVDIWLTNFNSVEFGVYKRARNRAKSRQFTADMDVFGEVIEEGTRTGLLAYRQDLWTKNSGHDKRLVFKLFSDKLNWRATMDLMLARSVQQTIGARGLPVMSYSINSNEHEQAVYVERSANKWPLMPENFSFFLLEDKSVEVYRIKQDLIRFGDDYTVFNGRDEVIGHLDGAVFTIAGKWRCRVKKDYAGKRLMTVLKLFTGMLAFNRQCRRHVSHLAHLVRTGQHEPLIEKQEADLYMNPRRIR